MCSSVSAAGSVTAYTCTILFFFCLYSTERPTVNKKTKVRGV